MERNAWGEIFLRNGQNGVVKDWRYRRKEREKFVQLAEGRTQNALRQIELLGNLQNRNSYEYSQRDYKKILGVLRGATNELQARFESREKANSRFEL